MNEKTLLLATLIFINGRSQYKRDILCMLSSTAEKLVLNNLHIVDISTFSVVFGRVCKIAKRGLLFSSYPSILRFVRPSAWSSVAH